MAFPLSPKGEGKNNLAFPLCKVETICFSLSRGERGTRKAGGEESICEPSNFRGREKRPIGPTEGNPAKHVALRYE